MSSPPMYESFAAVTMLVLGLLIVLARASEAMFDDPEDGDARGEGSVPATGAGRIERHRDTGRTRAERIERDVLAGEDDATPWPDDGEAPNPWADPDDLQSPDSEWATARPGETAGSDDRADDGAAAGRLPAEDRLDFSTGALLANVALSQGLFGVAIVGAAWLAEVPPAALGVDLGDPWSVGLPAVGVGVGVGVALYAANELSSTAADAAGVEYSEGLREALAPDTLRGWLVLLGVVLPIIAGFEELLFRAALVGAFSAGFGVSPWLLAAFSTAAFAVGHGAQGPGGVAVTGLLGFALAAAFVLTESLLVVVVAHYLVNALEFGVHEGLGVEWT